LSGELANALCFFGVAAIFLPFGLAALRAKSAPPEGWWDALWDFWGYVTSDNRRDAWRAFGWITLIGGMLLLTVGIVYLVLALS
jgi:hypothetical protein